MIDTKSGVSCTEQSFSTMNARIAFRVSYCPSEPFLSPLKTPPSSKIPTNQHSKRISSSSSDIFQFEQQTSPTKNNLGSKHYPLAYPPSAICASFSTQLLRSSRTTHLVFGNRSPIALTPPSPGIFQQWLRRAYTSPATTESWADEKAIQNNNNGNNRNWNNSKDEQTITISSSEEMYNIGYLLAKQIRSGDIICFFG